MMSINSIDSLLLETRRFPPPPEFASGGIASADLYERAAEDRVQFWADTSRDLLHWHHPFTQTLDWSNPPFAKWFADGTLNVAYNCLDRHVLAGNGDRVAFHWEGENGDTRTLTYSELTAEVKKAANLLAALGIEQGDRVAIYLPMIPEAVIAMLAVARLGAVHSVVFGGFRVCAPGSTTRRRNLSSRPMAGGARAKCSH
jgi:acetyl-CoA synthetase